MSSVAPLSPSQGSDAQRNAEVGTPPILQLHHVTRQFSAGANPAVCQISLALQPGSILALLGPSGCGKTTLLRLIAGFESPQSGQIEIAQQIVAGDRHWTPPEKRGVGMVFQDYALFPHLTVGQNVAFGLSDRLNKAYKQERVTEALTLVKLQGMEQRYPHQLSGGQQQRVALARALAPQPFLILLDEPLSNLDVQVRLELRQELRSILRAAGASAIFVTHDQEEALSIADQVAVMREGCLEQFGTPEALYQQPTSPFVAKFVTQSNLLLAERQGSVWRTEIGDYPIAQTQLFGTDETQVLDQVQLMLRPEDLTLQPDETSSIVISDRQFLGREYRYSLLTAQGQTVVVHAPQWLETGIKVKVAIAATQLQVFPV
jgi:iron(III) transport system ATP-binding protein